MHRAFLAVIAALAATSALAQEPPLKTGVDGTFAPHAMPNLSGGIQGFNVDLANEIAKRLNRKIEIEATQFSGLIPALQAGTYDFLAAPVTVTKERADNLLFTEGYLNTDFQFVVRKDAPEITRLEDFKGKVIAVNKGAAYDSWARELADKIGWTVESFGTNTDAVQAVISGRAFANVAGQHRGRLGGEEQSGHQAVLSLFHRPRLGCSGAQGQCGAAPQARRRHRMHEAGRHARKNAREVVWHQAGARLGDGHDLSGLRRARHAGLRSGGAPGGVFVRHRHCGVPERY